jgi:hypothetical protein
MSFVFTEPEAAMVQLAGLCAGDLPAGTTMSHRLPPDSPDVHCAACFCLAGVMVPATWQTDDGYCCCDEHRDLLEGDGLVELNRPHKATIGALTALACQAAS